jgi:putative tryptophan/tyrosine transport system substrate-binding protein
MDRRTFVAMTGGALLGLSPNLRAQDQVAPRRIGVLSPFPRVEVEAFVSLLRPELEKLGWTDGRNIVVLELRTTDGANDRLPSLAGELVAQGPDLILVQGVPATRALMQATKSIPIVMIGVGTPVELGIIADYRKPGGNVTGASYLADESSGKLLQFLKEAAPRLRSVAVFFNATNDARVQGEKQMRADAAALGMQAQILEVSQKDDFEAAFAAIRRANTESILLIPENLIRSNRGAIADFAQSHGLPLAIVGANRFLPASGLISYGPTTAQYAQMTAGYVDRILKGAKPGDLPVEQPSRFELTINLKTAKALSLTIPQSLLVRADEVIR